MIFIAGSRELSQKRFLELIKHYLKKDSVTFGFYTEGFILGFEKQIQFRTLKKERFKKIIEILKEKFQVPNSKFQIIEYSQKDEIELIEKLKPSKAIFINGSWKIAFHRRPIFQTLKDLNIEYSLKSPFCDEEEAEQFSNSIISSYAKASEDRHQFDNKKKYANVKICKCENENKLTSLQANKQTNSDKIFLKLAQLASTKSFDYTWQTGAVLVKNGEVIFSGHNRILPYETFSIHHGSLKEHGLGKFAIEMNDQNANDSLHAEMDIVSQALQKGFSLKGCDLYVTLMPCPNCARMLSTLGLRKIVCEGTHSGGYAKELLKSYGVEVADNVAGIQSCTSLV